MRREASEAGRGKVSQSRGLCNDVPIWNWYRGTVIDPRHSCAEARCGWLAPTTSRGKAVKFRHGRAAVTGGGAILHSPNQRCHWMLHLQDLGRQIRVPEVGKPAFALHRHPRDWGARCVIATLHTSSSLNSHANPHTTVHALVVHFDARSDCPLGTTR